MIPHDPLRICTTCAIAHVENCPDCWGFGVYKELSAEGETIPVSASAAIDGPLRREAIACPTCGGTIEGIGKKEMIAAIEQSWRARWKAIAKNYRLRLKNLIGSAYSCAERDAAQADSAALRQLLRDLEWDAPMGNCPDCGGRGPDSGHFTWCRLAPMLATPNPGAPLLAKLAAARTQFATLHAAVQQVIFTLNSRDEDAAALERALTALEQVADLNKESD